MYLVYLRKFKLFWPRLLKKRVKEFGVSGKVNASNCWARRAKPLVRNTSVVSRRQGLGFGALGLGFRVDLVAEWIHFTPF